MATAKMPVRLKGQNTCEHHKGKQLDFYCEQCKEPVCSKCVTSLHKGHLFCDLSEIIPQKKEKIRSFIDTTEQNVLQDIGNYIASAITLLTENDSTFEKLSTELKAQTEILKHDLDTLTAETISSYQNMKDKNTKFIQIYIQDLKMYETQLKQQMQECKKTLQQASPIEIFDTECEIGSTLHLPVKPMVATVSFTANKTPHNHLELALGTCKSVASKQGKIFGVKKRADSLSPEQRQSSTHQQSYATRKKAITSAKLLAKTKVVGEWKSPCTFDSVCPISDRQAWTSYQYSETLTLLNRKGKVIKETTHTSPIQNISLSPATHRIWACDKDNNILELVSGQLSVRFRTKNNPRCICVTADNHIIIGNPKQITKYTTQGQMVMCTIVIGFMKPLVYSPYRITECPVTNNIAVIDDNDVDDGGDGELHVVVMDPNFQELFTYRCNMSVTYKQAGIGYLPMNPMGIVYDCQGNIIIADHDNEKILILSGGGDDLRILHTGTDKVWAVGASRKGELWTANDDDGVKLLQYYE